MAQLVDTSLFSDANLVAYYKLEDENDSKGARTLTNGGTTAFVSAKFTNGAQFTTAGSKSLYRNADNYGIAGNADLSIPLWIKIDSAPGSGTAYCLFIHRSQTTSDRYIALKYYNNGGTLQLFIDNSGTTGSYNVDLGTTLYHHIVLVRQSTTGTKLYLNGADTSTSVAQGSGAAGANDFRISNDGGTQYVNGIIDDLAIFSDQLTSDEVLTLYNEPVAGGYFHMSV